MTHYRVLLVIKKRNNTSPTKDDFFDILEKNYTDEYYGEPTEPFGFDYLAPYSEVFRGSEVKSHVFSEIIIDGEEVWWCDGISVDEPKISEQEALKLIDKDDYCMLFDGHL